MSSFLKITREGSIAILTMSQPETRNALTGNTAVEEFVQACADITKDTSIRAVILTAEGPVFSSGGNVKDMLRYQTQQLKPDVIREEYRNGIQRLPKALYNLDVPVIAAINGPAIGAGLDLTCMCDIRIASDKATFAESFVKVGIVPGDGGAWLLPRAIGWSRAAQLYFTGDVVDAQTAREWGLVSEVYPDDQLMNEAEKLAGRIIQQPPQALRMTKRLMREGQGASFDNIMEMSAAMQVLVQRTDDHLEAVNAFFEKRQPEFKGK
jgi:enoyl-CoA hydratase/carnithine racemase